MPVNKAARFRFEVIDECLRNSKKKWSKAELLKYVNRQLEIHYDLNASISISQLRYDLENMQTEYGAPIEMYKEGRQFYYRYEDPSFSIRNIPVAEEDILKLNNAVQLLHQMKGFAIADDMAEVIKRLENRYDFSVERERTIISFDTSPDIQGIEYIEDIYHSILRNNVLKITYQSFHNTIAGIWNIHPYLLKEFNKRWYLLGYCQEKECIRIYALDRMKEIHISKLPFKRTLTEKWDSYFNDLIGVTILPNKQQVEQIRLLFSSEYAPYIITQPLHHSQQLIKKYDDGQLEIQLNLIINPELMRMLLSYGKDVKVLAPQSLSDEIQQVIQELLSKYKH